MRNGFMGELETKAGNKEDFEPGGRLELSS